MNHKGFASVARLGFFRRHVQTLNETIVAKVNCDLEALKLYCVNPENTHSTPMFTILAPFRNEGYQKGWETATVQLSPDRMLPLLLF